VDLLIGASWENVQRLQRAMGTLPDHAIALMSDAKGGERGGPEYRPILPATGFCDLVTCCVTVRETPDRQHHAGGRSVWF
jgi:hypothetical protein